QQRVRELVNPELDAEASESAGHGAKEGDPSQLRVTETHGAVDALDGKRRMDIPLLVAGVPHLFGSVVHVGGAFELRQKPERPGGCGVGQGDAGHLNAPPCRGDDNAGWPRASRPSLRRWPAVAGT